MNTTRGTRRSLAIGAVRRTLRRAHQRRVLSTMEYMLSRTDPPLAAKFEMFSRLASSEAIPRIDQGIPLRRPGRT